MLRLRLECKWKVNDDDMPDTTTFTYYHFHITSYRLLLLLAGVCVWCGEVSVQCALLWWHVELKLEKSSSSLSLGPDRRPKKEVDLQYNTFPIAIASNVILFGRCVINQVEDTGNKVFLQVAFFALTCTD